MSADSEFKDEKALHLAIAIHQTTIIEEWLDKLVPHVESTTGKTFTDRDRNVIRGLLTEPGRSTSPSNTRRSTGPPSIPTRFTR